MSRNVECPQWRSSIFNRYIKDQVSPAELVKIHNHFNECTLCYHRFVVPMKESLALTYQDNLTNEDAPAEKASWQLFKKDLIAIAQQANSEQVSFDLAYHQLAEAKRLQSENIDYLATLGNSEGQNFPLPSLASKIAFLPAKTSYKRNQLLTNIFKVAALIMLAAAPFALVWQSGLLKSHTTISQGENSMQLTRYELIDHHIDNYLQARSHNDADKASKELKEAEEVAQEMFNKTQDVYGQDLVSYYRSLPNNQLAVTMEARHLAQESLDIQLRNQPNQIIAKAQEAKVMFEKLGNQLEQEELNFTLAKYLQYIGKTTEAQELVTANIDNAKKQQHLLSYAKLLYSQAFILGEHGKHAEQIELLNEDINLISKLEVPEFLIYISDNLARIYFVSNDDQKALKEAQATLGKAQSVKNHRLLIDLNQIAGITAFKLKEPQLAESYLHSSLKLAEQEQDDSYLVQGYWMMGLIKAEMSQFEQSDEFFQKAFQKIDRLADHSMALHLEATVTGYYARKEALAKDYQKSINLYTHSIELARQATPNNHLMLSQLHQGLGEGLKALGRSKDSDSQFLVALELDKKAQENLEQNNTLFTFALTQKDPQDYLKREN